MPFTYNATINDANDSIPAKITQAVGTATAPLNNKAQSLKIEIDALTVRVAQLEAK